MDKVPRLSTNDNLFEEKGEPKRYRTEVPPLTSLTGSCFFFFFPWYWLIALTIMCWWSLKSYSGSETCLSKATNVIMVPHQDQVFDNPSALCLALWARHQIWHGGGGGGGGTDTHKRLFMLGTYFFNL